MANTLKKDLKSVFKPVTGYGVVGEWFAPENTLGGTLPQWLSKTESHALSEVVGNQRMRSFLGVKASLCKITIEPLDDVDLQELLK